MHMDESLRNLLSLPDSAQLALILAARDAGPVRGLTHGFYKYPARFSPKFVRAAIDTFTRPGDLVLDPHVGGGTTLVEALASDRDAVGVDISELAEFVAKVKTTVFSVAELATLDAWSNRLPKEIDLHKPGAAIGSYAELGYYKHLDHPSRWRLRKAIEQCMTSAIRLGKPRLESFGRCVILRAAQWALDGRPKNTTIDEFRAYLGATAQEMVEGARQLRTAVQAHGGRRPLVEVINRSAAGLENEPRVLGLRPPRLVLTSPPYPGVHVLYHRWQVDGRKEAPLPFMIANKLDGAGSSYYTMGDRKNPGLKTYFDAIHATMSSVAALADHQTVVVQMLAFSKPDWQLKRYLKTMRDAGLEEVFLPALSGQGDGRLWRSVPGRRWYSEQRGATPGSKEVVLIHVKQGPVLRTGPDLTATLPLI
jgi:hypothetical protein